MPAVNRSMVRRMKLTEEKSDHPFWVNQPVAARIDALESIREEYNSWKFHDQQRFQRVYRVIKQE